MTNNRMLRWRAPWMAWWLAMALVLAPALGRMHEVLHLPQHHTSATDIAHPLTTLASAADGGRAQAHALGLLTAWDSHELADCLVLDQLGHALDTPAHALPWPHAMPQHLAQPGAGWHWLPIPTASFEARAPPLPLLA